MATENNKLNIMQKLNFYFWEQLKTPFYVHPPNVRKSLATFLGQGWWKNCLAKYDQLIFLFTKFSLSFTKFMQINRGSITCKDAAERN